MVLGQKFSYCIQTLCFNGSFITTAFVDVIVDNHRISNLNLNLRLALYFMSQFLQHTTA